MFFEDLINVYMQLDDILKSDIFFFVTTTAVVIVTLIIVIIGIYAIKILKDVKSTVKDLNFRYRFIKKLIKKIIQK